jgi:transposase
LELETASECANVPHKVSRILKVLGAARVEKSTQQNDLAKEKENSSRLAHALEKTKKEKRKLQNEWEERSFGNVIGNACELDREKVNSERLADELSKLQSEVARLTAENQRTVALERDIKRLQRKNHQSRRVRQASRNIQEYSPATA